MSSRLASGGFGGFLCLALLSAPLPAAEQFFELTDGRVLRGEAVRPISGGAGTGTLEILVQAAGIEARIAIPKARIKAVKPVPEQRPQGPQDAAPKKSLFASLRPASKVAVLKQAGAPAAARTPPASPLPGLPKDPKAHPQGKASTLGAGEPLRVKRKGAGAGPPSRKTAERRGDFARMRFLLREAARELARDAAPPQRPAHGTTPLPQDLDPATYWDLYGPFLEGSAAENFKGLVFREGVLPGARSLSGGVGSVQFLGGQSLPMP